RARDVARNQSRDQGYFSSRLSRRRAADRIRVGNADFRKGGPVVEDRQHVRVHRVHRDAGEEAMIRRAIVILVVGASVSAGAQRTAACAKPSQTAPWMLV